MDDTVFYMTLDFIIISCKKTRNGYIIEPLIKDSEVSKDLMIKGHRFYAIWDKRKTKWCDKKRDVRRLVDECIRDYIKERGWDQEGAPSLDIRWASIENNGFMKLFENYCRNTADDNFIPLNSKLVFKSDPYVRENYSTFRLDYDLVDEPTPYYDKLAHTLYSEEDLEKIEWIIGAVLAGDNARIQKFLVLYGKPGTGKSTMIDIINELFKGYTSSFNAADLGSSTKAFSLEPFRDNPVIAYQHDGDLSRIEDNTKLNSIVSHEIQPINEKNKSIYQMRITSVLILGTNKEVRISDAKSGLLRRLLCARPTNKKLTTREYRECKDKIKFELGAIAHKCLKFYKDNPYKYEDHIDKEMFAGTNAFFDFMSTYYEQFLGDDEMDGYTSGGVAWDRYKKYYDDMGSRKELDKVAFQSELKNFFEDYILEGRILLKNGERKHVRSAYIGFKKEFMYVDNHNGIRPNAEKIGDNDAQSHDSHADIFKGMPDWLRLVDVSEDLDAVKSNVFNVYFEDVRAQIAYRDRNDDLKNTRPKKAWDDWKGKLKAIDTRREHFVLCQDKEPSLIFLDFDNVNPKTGEKDLRRNLELAKQFPKTYAETSRSGGGLHLYYIYDGDPRELSSLYDTGIEIKVMTGKQSLRRKLYLCNNLPIARINSGLPLKEVKKVLDEHQINDEKHLRNKIKKALRRGVHANTRPSIDYIKMVLTEAYDSGMKYDVSDLRQSVMNFAAGSTNQAEYCMRVVLDLPFCSEEPSTSEIGGPNDGYSDEPVAFFDCEVFPNLFIVCYLVDDGDPNHLDKKDVVRLINPSANDVPDLEHKYRLIGFNNLDYDNHILYGRIQGYTNEEIYRLSQAIITNQKDAGFRESKSISYTDVYDFSNTKQSLKKWEIELGINHQEFPLRWDEPVPEDMWELAADYCSNDVVATKATFYYKDIRADWEARQVLSKLSGLDVNSRTNNHSARIVFGKNRNPQSSFNYPDLSKEFPGYEFNQFGIDKTRYNLGADGKPVATTGKSIFMGDDPSEGGYVYFETGIHYNVVLLDIASLHPSTIEVLQLFGPEYTARFSEIKNARVAIKHKDWNAARGYLDGMLVPFLEGVESLDADQQQALSDSLSYAFKIVINAIYGCTSAPFPNPFKDPRNIDNVVAKRGALFMILLKHEVQKRGFTVAHVKTDSIKIPNATQEIIDFVMDFGKKYGYTFEHEATYTKMCLVNKSVYIAKYDEYGERTKGGRHANQWTATGAEFKHPYIFKTLFSHEPITFKDYCETKSASGGGALYLDYNEKLTEELERELCSLKEELDRAEKGKLDIRRAIKAKQEEIDSVHSLSFVGKCGLFTPVEPGVGGGYLLRVDGEKVQAVTGTKGYRWLESTAVKEKHLEDRIDTGYFRTLIDNTRAHIGKYGDADEFIEDD